ncbi:MAG TPA: hypothetical protein VJ804_11740 [Acidimicrobiales bacterium]|nr:hypothetical protein [Acidimicrobiales bacterium]
MGFDVETLLAKAGESLTAGRSYGPVVEHDGAMVIPAAWVIGAGGGGGGEGPPEGEHAGGGSGGGWLGISWPVGAYVIRGGEVRWVSAIDASRLALGVLGLAGAMIKLRAKQSAR